MKTSYPSLTHTVRHLRSFLPMQRRHINARLLEYVQSFSELLEWLQDGNKSYIFFLFEGKLIFKESLNWVVSLTTWILNNMIEIHFSYISPVSLIDLITVTFFKTASSTPSGWLFLPHLCSFKDQHIWNFTLVFVIAEDTVSHLFIFDAAFCIH